MRTCGELLDHWLGMERRAGRAEEGVDDEPSINNNLRKRRIICVPLGQAPTAPCTEDEHEIATMALEIFAGWVSTGMRSRPGCVTKSL